MTSYVVFRIMLAILAGAVAYVLDRRWGAGLYAWWYRMTHSKPLPDGVMRGYIFGQPAKVRATAATVLSTIVTALCIMFANVNALTELFMWVAGIPSLFVGFLLGPLSDRLWRRRDSMFDAVDKWEQGEVDLSREVKERTTSLGGRLSGWLKGLFAHAPNRPSQAEKPPQIEPPKETLPAPDPDQLVEQFVKPRTPKDRDGN